jgi:hypothetical protein
MSLDVTLVKIAPVDVFSKNITHNLGKMAAEVKLSNGRTLYEVLWRPDEHNIKVAEDLAELLDEGWNILLGDPAKFKQFNPENGWGSYEGLCDFVYHYRNACWENPDADVEVSR